MVAATARAKISGGLGELVADDVRVHAQCDRGVRVAESGGDHVHRPSALSRAGGGPRAGRRTCACAEPPGARTGRFPWLPVRVIAGRAAQGRPRPHA
jgi:hypothetical protein